MLLNISHLNVLFFIFYMYQCLLALWSSFSSWVPQLFGTTTFHHFWHIIFYSIYIQSTDPASSSRALPFLNSQWHLCPYDRNLTPSAHYIMSIFPVATFYFGLSFHVHPAMFSQTWFFQKLLSSPHSSTRPLLSITSALSSPPHLQLSGPIHIFRQVAFPTIPSNNLSFNHSALLSSLLHHVYFVPPFLPYFLFFLTWKFSLTIYILSIFQYLIKGAFLDQCGSPFIFL